MTEKEFWHIIDLFDWGHKRPQDIVEAAMTALSKYPESEIMAFDECLAKKLYALDGEKYATYLGWQEHTYFSVDAFLYARCGVVANGKALYEKILKKPELMPKDCSFEPLLYLAEKAYHLKTNSDNYDYLPKVSYETFSNNTAWPGMPGLESLIRGTVR